MNVFPVPARAQLSCENTEFEPVLKPAAADQVEEQR